MNFASIGLGERGRLALEPLLGANEIQDGEWILWYEMSHRTLGRGAKYPEDERARAIGSVTGRRGYSSEVQNRKIE